MSTWLGVIVAAAVGILLAAGGSFALVSSQTTTDTEQIEAPLVSYGSQS